MISFDLTDEQHLLEQSVREWAAREMAPHIREADRQHRFDRDRVLGGMAEPWAAGHLGAAGIRRRRHGLHLSRPCQRRARIRRHVAAGDHVGSRRSELPVAPDVGHRAAETAVPGPAGAGKDDRRLRADRTRRGQRCPRHPDDGREEGRSVRAERREVVDLARRRRRQLPRRRLDGSREEETARSVRPQRVHRPAHLQGLFERAR